MGKDKQFEFMQPNDSATFCISIQCCVDVFVIYSRAPTFRYAHLILFETSIRRVSDAQKCKIVTYVKYLICSTFGDACDHLFRSVYRFFSSFEDLVEPYNKYRSHIVFNSFV
jgi:hypothetical protein